MGDLMKVLLLLHLSYSDNQTWTAQDWFPGEIYAGQSETVLPVVIHYWTKVLPPQEIDSTLSTLSTCLYER